MKIIGLPKMTVDEFEKVVGEEVEVKEVSPGVWAAQFPTARAEVLAADGDYQGISNSPESAVEELIRVLRGMRLCFGRHQDTKRVRVPLALVLRRAGGELTLSVEDAEMSGW